MYLNIKLDDKEQKNFEVAKEKSGLKSNTEFLRSIIKKYILKVHGSFPDAKFKMYKASDLFEIEELIDNTEPSYRKGFVQGFCYANTIPKIQLNKVEDILHDWRHKENNESFLPPDIYVSNKLKEKK